MPRLTQRSDGCFIVRHFYQENSTWQIDADGVRFLRDRGVGPGSLFPTDLFMQLWTRGLVYTTQSRPRKPEPAVQSENPQDAALRNAASEFYGALFRRTYEGALEVLLPEIREAHTVKMFAASLLDQGTTRLVAWKVRDVSSRLWHDESMPGARLLGIVVADLEVTMGSRERRRLPSCRECWVYLDNRWFWAWQGGPLSTQAVEV